MNVRRIGLGTLLATTMAVSTAAPATFAVLATTLRSEFGVARWQIGALVTVVMGVAATMSPAVGRRADQLLPRYSTGLTLTIAGVGFLAMSIAPGYWWLAAAAIFAGIANAASNPSTNLLIIAHADVGRRGFLTGVKQGGVQAGNFLVGLLIPLGAASMLGWRGSIAVMTVVCAFGLLLLWFLVRDRPAGQVSRTAPWSGRTAPVIFRLAAYGALMGLCTGSLLTHLPSFAQEAFGWTPTTGGLLVSVFSGVGFISRLTAGPISERFFSHHGTLTVLAALTALAGLGLAAAPSAGWLWPTAVVIGLGPMAWNVIGNLAVMELSPAGGAGRGSGIMMAGFLGGQATGAPLLGWSVDLLGTYRVGWAAVAGLALVAAVAAQGVRVSPDPAR